MGIFKSAHTKSALKKRLKKEHITVNNVIATTATLIHGGEHIKILTPEDDPQKKQFVFPLKVLFEDRHLAIVHKPAGILVSGNSFKTITNALAQNLEPSDEPEATIPKPVHRLDYPTTGVLLVGKTASSIRRLNKLFENKEVSKIYYAITINRMDKHGEITSTIDGKKSLTEYTVERSTPSKRFGQLNLVRLTPFSGRRHQLRKHLSGIGNPILGDKEYGIENLILKGKGLYLHAYSLEFVHPFTHEHLQIQDDLPTRFSKIFEGQAISE